MLAYDPKIEEFNKLPDQYIPEGDDLKFIEKVYTDFEKDRRTKNLSYRYLGDRSLTTFWDNCVEDYNVYIPPTRADDWMKMYRRPISRDKANTFISHLAQQLMSPMVVAQNKRQQTDREISRVLRSLLSHAEANDGRPQKSGLRKFVDIVHKCVIEGTVHVQEDFDEDAGKACKEIIPNEEIFIPNFWQADIQKQAHVIRFQDKILYEEAEMEFGKLPNWKYVVPGNTAKWQIGNRPFFKDLNFQLTNDEVHIVRIWRPVPTDKLTKGKKLEKYFNILINGVLMFDVDNKMPYKHGLYPIGKEVFEMFDYQFYWGNSLPNKAREDQKIYDTFYTLILNKEKLNVNPPLASLNGLHIDQDIVVPGKISQVDGDPTRDLVKIPGVAEGVNNSEFSILNLLEKSIDNSTSAPITSGQSSGGRRTAREVILQEENARQMLGIFGLMMANLVEQLGYLRIRNLIQFVPRRRINELCQLSIPGQPLASGRTGDMEIIFKKAEPLELEQKDKIEEDLLQLEHQSNLKGQPKEFMFIDPGYLDELDLYVEVTAETMIKPSTAVEKALAVESYQLLAANPLINQEENTRELLRGLGKDENALIKQQASPMGQPGMEGMEQGGNAVPGMPPAGSATSMSRNITSSPSVMSGMTKL